VPRFDGHERCEDIEFTPRPGLSPPLKPVACVRAIWIAGWRAPSGTWQRSKMGVDRHLEVANGHARIQKRNGTFPRLKLRVRAPSPAAPSIRRP